MRPLAPTDCTAATCDYFLGGIHARAAASASMRICITANASVMHQLPTSIVVFPFLWTRGTRCCIRAEWQELIARAIASANSASPTNDSAPFVTPPTVGKQGIATSVSVSLSVREHVSGTTRPIFIDVLRMLPMAVARSSSGGVPIRCPLPVLWVASCLHVMAGNRRRKKTRTQGESKGGSIIWHGGVYWNLPTRRQY